jgi:hypothetical protein
MTHLVPVEGIPDCEPNTSRARLISNGSTLAVIYESKGPGWPHCDECWAVVRFEWCMIVKAGSPNDEARVHHPLYTLGLGSSCSLQRVVDSPWFAEQCQLADRDGDGARQAKDRHHFVFAFKEDTLECIARNCTVIGEFSGVDDAAAAALRTTGMSP